MQKCEAKFIGSKNKSFGAFEVINVLDNGDLLFFKHKI